MKMNRLTIVLLCLVPMATIATGQTAWRPADPEATPEAVALMERLHTLQGKGVMYGHQDDLLYGYTWWGEAERSDTRDATGDYPAIAGFELGELELGYKVSLDSVAFADIRNRWRWWHAQGGIVTVSWHVVNPVSSQWPGIKEPNGAGSAWDVGMLSADGIDAVRSVLPGGTNNAMFTQWLDRLARFFLSIRDDGGRLIPFIFRPWHEHSGSFFWWGRTRCTDDEYAQLWRWTVSYLRSKGLHQILYAYNTDKVYSAEEYLRGYPGDEYVDMLTLDWYGQGDDFVRDAGAALSFVGELAEQKDKPFALSECGPLSPGLTEMLADSRCSYLLTWRHAPLRGRRRAWGREQHEQNLQQLKEHPKFLFLEEIKK